MLLLDIGSCKQQLKVAMIQFVNTCDTAAFRGKPVCFYKWLANHTNLHSASKFLDITDLQSWLSEAGAAQKELNDRQKAATVVDLRIDVEIFGADNFNNLTKAAKDPLSPNTALEHQKLKIEERRLEADVSRRNFTEFAFHFRIVFPK